MFSTLVFGYFSGITHFDLILGFVFFVIFSISMLCLKAKTIQIKSKIVSWYLVLAWEVRQKMIFFQKQLVSKLMESPERGFQNGFLKKFWLSDSGDIFKFSLLVTAVLQKMFFFLKKKKKIKLNLDTWNSTKNSFFFRINQSLITLPKIIQILKIRTWDLLHVKFYGA